MAAVMACSARAAISIVGVGARPHRAEASVNPVLPTRNTRLRPKMSPSLPPVMRNTEKPMP